ncbi:amidohydrolase [Microthyrium microscopicum]|uniref:Amidohydrolase n=1 Tax=Microthyrium microscopicum TaxID=703497 RepID=A0A6A6TXU1_9PEZI|nr:amidohydrolase [Microthyrium microscopicum]
MEKGHLEDLPSYNSAIRPWPLRNRRGPRRIIRFLAPLCLLFFGYYTYLISQNTAHPTNNLSITKLQEQHASCAELRRVPTGPVGPRSFSGRWVNGTKPVLIRNATVWTGEPAPGTSEEDARRGIGYSWTPSDVLLDRGLIVQVAEHISASSLPEGTVTYDAKGRQLTAGIVDMHSHAGLGGFASLGDDTNELSGDITPYVKSIDGFNPLAPELQWIKAGGVTTSLILPGSGNNMGGEAFVLKLASGKASGRAEISQQDMFADPSPARWRYMKMACGENPKNVYGKIGKGPFSRLGEAWEFRHAFDEARKYVEAQNDWCAAADRVGAENMADYLPSELQWESLAAALRGQVRVNTHCYTVPDLEAFVRHTNEFKFRVYAFHHAHQTYLVPEVLKRAYGGTPAAALFADNMYYKVEAYTASEKAGKILYDEGIQPVYVSDNPVLNSRHVVFEAAKAYSYGLPYHIALAGVTSKPAELLGLGESLGKVKEGFDADIVVWDSDPLSIAATPVQVWIDGAPQFEKPVELKKSLSKPTKPDTILQEDLTRKENGNVIFTGLTRDFLSANDIETTARGKVNVVVANGAISCVGTCDDEVKTFTANKQPIIELHNGHLTPTFTAIGSALGLVEIDAEKATQDGPYSEDSFARAIDGLGFGGKQLSTVFEHGGTRAISAPSTGSINAKGISVGFLTDGITSLGNGSVWQEEVALHYPLTQSSKSPSISSALGKLRTKLLQASKPLKKKDQKEVDPFSEESYLRQVVAGKLPLVLSIHKADTIASVIRMKKEVETASSKAELTSSKSKSKKLRIVILGGAESYLVADELAAANVSVILAPLLPYAQSWDQRRTLPGAPLTHGSAIDLLLDAGVLVAIGVGEVWETRNLNLMAGWAWRNGEGRLSEKKALDLVGKNIYDMLDLKAPSAKTDWAVWDGSPLDIGSRLRGIGSAGRTTIWI